ncbi:hypothetical protein [Fimbriiglobus ruber]|uniref:Uncharacterized protein n=1 Tax=Fimbriiglobus ruber TaxID=1908690 RepID=A0A225DUR4_9BACT|nr:hypothetical protein [Fimbriiglobus ruber]OWK39887.1 hypothetical protein FRUB_05777 [Fimbriiglobus ruber]
MGHNHGRQSSATQIRPVVDQLEDRVTPSFSSQLQTLIANAAQFSSTGDAVAQATGLDTPIPIIDQSLDSILNVRGDFTRIATALAAINPSGITDNADLASALHAVDPSDYYAYDSGPGGPQVEFFPSTSDSAANPTVSVANTAAGLGGGTPAYFSSAALSGSGTLSVLVSGGITFGANDSGAYLLPGTFLSSSVNGSTTSPVSGTVQVGSDSLPEMFSGSATISMLPAFHLSDPTGTGQVPLTDVAGNVAFTNASSLQNSDSVVSLSGDVTVGVLGVPLVTWGTTTGLRVAAPLLSWSADGAAFSAPR